MLGWIARARAPNLKSNPNFQQKAVHEAESARIPHAEQMIRNLTTSGSSSKASTTSNVLPARSRRHARQSRPGWGRPGRGAGARPRAPRSTRRCRSGSIRASLRGPNAKPRSAGWDTRRSSTRYCSRRRPDPESRDGNASSPRAWDPKKTTEGEGFEPPSPCGLPVFKTGAIDQLGHPSGGDALVRRYHSGATQATGGFSRGAGIRRAPSGAGRRGLSAR